jgi:S1-C subfamily serine protease
VGVWRDKKIINIDIKMEKMPQEFLAGKFLKNAPNRGLEESEGSEIKELGLTVQDINEDLAQKYDYSPKLKGAVIVAIDPQGEGAQAGLAEGDVFLKVQNKAVKSTQELMSALKKASFKEGVTFFVRSASGGARYVYIKID